MLPIIEPCILTNLFFVCTIHWVKVCEHLPTSDIFYKSVYYLILAKKHQSQLIICSRAARWAAAWKEGGLIWKWVGLRYQREGFQGFSLIPLEFKVWIDYNRGVKKEQPPHTRGWPIKQMTELPPNTGQSIQGWFFCARFRDLENVTD